ncbi:hypothetical protein [Candidatus Nitrosocosmicus sp. R]
MNWKLVAVFAISFLMMGVVVATGMTLGSAYADNPPKYSGPGESGKVSSNSFKQCEKKSPGNSPCR